MFFEKKNYARSAFSRNKKILKILFTSVGFKSTPPEKLLCFTKQATYTTRPQLDPPPTYCLIITIYKLFFS